MKYLVIGSGGREHAFVWRLKQDEPDAEVFIAPGNAGTGLMGTNLPIPVSDLDGLVAWATRERPDLTIVGPEAPLCAGVVDRFEAAGLAIFGPRQAAARLEGSKVYTKNFLLKYGLPTAPGACFDSSAEALAYSRAHPNFPQVIKADGLAAGKGVIIAQDAAEAEKAIREIMAQDHKKLLDGDKGPNTGGMGAYAPAPFATPELIERVKREIVRPVLAAFKKEKINFQGILYIGLIWSEVGPQILEFNVRGGDPETQVLLPLLKTPLAEILHAITEKRLRALNIEFQSLYAVSVVMAARGYPESPQFGDVISGLENDVSRSFTFHGGTALKGNKCLTSGGRVLSVTAWGADLADTRYRVYGIVEKIVFAGSNYRYDIADNWNL
jgi:phosphoribosylamine--glycine ligase